MKAKEVRASRSSLASSELDYQLDLVIPGIMPYEASSLKVRRDNLNLRRKPLARPVIWQRFLRRQGEESRGILFSATLACSLSSSVKWML